MCSLVADVRSPAFMRPLEPKMTPLRVRQLHGLSYRVQSILGWIPAPRMGEFVNVNRIQLVATDDEMDASE